VSCGIILTGEMVLRTCGSRGTRSSTVLFTR
jgi:hypothetical protein